MLIWETAGDSFSKNFSLGKKKKRKKKENLSLKPERRKQKPFFSLESCVG